MGNEMPYGNFIKHKYDIACIKRPVKDFDIAIHTIASSVASSFFLLTYSLTLHHYTRECMHRNTHDCILNYTCIYSFTPFISKCYFFSGEVAGLLFFISL